MIFICAECGTEIVDNPSANRVVCSFGCLGDRFRDKPLCEDTKEKMRLKKIGKYGKEANHWKGGKCSERDIETSREEYKIFRKSVFDRDGYMCQICEEVGGKLEMHHIKEWCNYPELRYEEDNCITLCRGCHSLTDNYQGKAFKGLGGQGGTKAKTPKKRSGRL